MRVLVAPDSFKECMSAREAGVAIASGLIRVDPKIEVELAPMGDGGEGTAECLSEVLECEKIEVKISGPLLSPISSSFYYNRSTRYAVIESAAACGLALVPSEHRNPLLTSSRGVGELIHSALDCGAQRILVAIGGTATVDFGTGMASALGYEFLDNTGKLLPAGGGALCNLATIRKPSSRTWENSNIVGACDVSNRLLGEEGATKVFGPQKGARDKNTIMQLENALRRVQDVLDSQLHIRVGDEIGAGAGGGLGAGLKAFLNAQLVSGVKFVIDCLELEEKIRRSDLVITGEGSTDNQSIDGKVCSGVCSLAKRYDIPCFIISGQVVEPVDILRNMGASDIVSISPAGEHISESLAKAKRRLTRVASQLILKYMEQAD